MICSEIYGINYIYYFAKEVSCMTCIDEFQSNVFYVTTPFADFIPCDFIKRNPIHTDFLFFHSEFKKYPSIKMISQDEILYAMESEYKLENAVFCMSLDIEYDITSFWVKKVENVGIVRKFIESIIQNNRIQNDRKSLMHKNKNSDPVNQYILQ